MNRVRASSSSSSAGGTATHRRWQREILLQVDQRLDRNQAGAGQHGGRALDHFPAQFGQTLAELRVVQTPVGRPLADTGFPRRIFGRGAAR
jgi:hypothetical protein